MTDNRANIAPTPRWLGSALAGGTSAVLFGFGATAESFLVTLLIYLSPLPLFVAGLAFGASSLAIGTLVACAVLAAMIGKLGIVVVYGATYALPVLGLVWLALRSRTNDQGQVFWYPESKLIAALPLYPVVFFVFASAYAYATGEETGLLGLSLRGLDQIMETIAQTAASGPESTQEIAGTLKDSLDQIKPVAEKIANYLPCLIGYVWISLMFLNGLASIVWLKKTGRALRSGFSLAKVEVSYAFLAGLAAVGVVSFFVPDDLAYVGFNTLGLLFFPLILAGLAVVHGYAGTLQASKLFLSSVYLALMCVPWLFLIVAVLGAADLHFRFRQRFAQLPKPVSKV
jgi:hypothetical protein